MNARKSVGLVTGLMAGALALAVLTAKAQDPGTDDVMAAVLEAHQYGVSADLQDVERAYWRCDYIATMKGASQAPTALCAPVAEELKIRWFGGSAERMQAWRERNKPAAFESLVLLYDARL